MKRPYAFTFTFEIGPRLSVFFRESLLLYRAAFALLSPENAAPPAPPSAPAPENTAPPRPASEGAEVIEPPPQPRAKEGDL